MTICLLGMSSLKEGAMLHNSCKARIMQCVDAAIGREQCCKHVTVEELLDTVFLLWSLMLFLSIGLLPVQSFGVLKLILI